MRLLHTSTCKYCNATTLPPCTVRQNIKNFEADYEKSENDIKALQSVGQIVGEVTRQLDEERCRLSGPAHAEIKAHAGLIYATVIVKASSGPRYVVGCRASVNRDKLKPGTRVSLDMTTLTVMR